MSEDYAKKRRFPRIPSSNPIMVRRLGPESVTRLTTTRVMGLGGCMFVNKESFGKDSLLSLLILVQGHYVDAKARVVYELPKENASFDIGVEFLEISDEDRGIIQTLFEANDAPPA